MLVLTIVTTALLLGALGLYAERHRRTIELWACNAAAAVLLAATVLGHVNGRIA
ncbi:MAG TPA: hypothetical protein VFQ85_18440 [Mycobacteriales bacterium]|jgi:hypothetical protein|nr:hypothetical protein [Mycobacteriales bacterium]